MERLITILLKIIMMIFTCGGTAGHINPAIAVANAMREKYPDCKILFIGAEDASLSERASGRADAAAARIAQAVSRRHFST